MTSHISFNVASWVGWGGQIIPNTSPPTFFTFRHLWLAIEDDPAILLRSLLQTRKSFNFFLMTTWQSSLYYTNVPLHIRFRKKFHSSFKLFALNPLFISYDKWYFVSEIVLTCCEKRLLWWSRKTFEIRCWKPSFKRPEQFLKQNAFSCACILRNS